VAERRDRSAVASQVAGLGRQGCLTERDDLLLRTLGEVRGLSLGQAQRLFWQEASTVVAYQRLNKLRSWGLLASRPLPPDGAAWGLGPGPVYLLGPAGQLWLNPCASLDWRGLAGHWAEPLLATELLVRLVESGLALGWRGSATLQAELKVELPVAGAARWQQGEVIFHVVGLVQRGIDWAGLVRAFDQVVWGGRRKLSPVALLLPDAAQAALVGDLISTQRRGQVTYLLATWPALAGAGDLFTAPIWQFFAPNEQPVDGRSLAKLFPG